MCSETTKVQQPRLRPESSAQLNLFTRARIQFLSRSAPLVFARLLLLTALIGIAHSAQATITFQGVTNYSGLDQSTAAWVIYGGIAGDDTPAGSRGGLWDNCANASNSGKVACNTQRINGDLPITITFLSDTSSGIPTLFPPSTSGTTTVAIPTVNGSPTSSTAKSATSVTVLWSSICAALVSANVNNAAAINNDCTLPPQGSGAATGAFTLGFRTNITDPTSTGDTIAVTITVSGDTGTLSGVGTSESIASDCEGVAGNNDYGVCAWEILPGDEKATLENITPSSNGTTGHNGLAFRGVRVFYEPFGTGNTYSTPPGFDAGSGTSTPAFNTITSKSKSMELAMATAATGTVNTSPSLSNSRVTGLTNDTQYMFKLAMVDMAGNVGYYTADSTVGTDGDFFCQYFSNRFPNTCHIATPGEVEGVLAKNVNCFIATAAFGSNMAPQVETFRQFRNVYLLTNKWGTAFVRFYYKHSPKYARFIAQSTTLRAIARAFLWPVLAYAWLSLHVGALTTTLLIVFLFAVLFFGIRRYQGRGLGGSLRE